MKRLFSILALGLCLSAQAANTNYVSAMVNETNGQCLPLALEGRLQGMTNAAASAQARADLAYLTATGAVQTASNAYDIATNALASATNGVDSAARASAALAGANATNAHNEAITVGAVASNAALSVAALSNVTIRGATVADGAANSVTTNAGILAFVIKTNAGGGSTDIGGLVPYTGAASNVALGAYSLSIGEGVPTNVPSWVTAPVLFSMSGLYGLNLLINSGTTNAATTNGAIAIGFGLRDNTGRAGLWLSSRDTDGADNSADIYFGRGNALSETSINWIVSSRYSYRTGGHNDGRRFAIFQGAGLGPTMNGMARLAITPDGAVVASRNIQSPEAFSNDTLVARGVANTAFRIKCDTNAASSYWAQMFMDSGTNSILFRYGDGNKMFGIYPVWLGHDVFVITNSGAVTIDQAGHGTKVGGPFTLGTNSPITNWSDIATSGDGGATQIVSQCGGYTGTYNQTTRTLTMPPCTGNSSPFPITLAYGGVTNWISPTNGIDQMAIATGAVVLALGDVTTNYVQRISLNLYAAGSVTWITTNLSLGTAYASTNAWSYIQFRSGYGTNRWLAR